MSINLIDRAKSIAMDRLDKSEFTFELLALYLQPVIEVSPDHGGENRQQ
ncbi:MAG: hypothetical protein ACREA9_13470 [Pyrinomonadaceae bacterium]